MKLYDKNVHVTCNITSCHLLYIKEICSVINLISPCDQGNITQKINGTIAAAAYCSKEALIGEHNQKPLLVIATKEAT